MSAGQPNNWFYLPYSCFYLPLAVGQAPMSSPGAIHSILVISLSNFTDTSSLFFHAANHSYIIDSYPRDYFFHDAPWEACGVTAGFCNDLGLKLYHSLEFQQCSHADHSSCNFPVEVFHDPAMQENKVTPTKSNQSNRNEKCREIPDEIRLVFQVHSC